MHLALRQRFRSLPSRFLNSFSASFRQPRALARKHKSLRCSCCTFARPSPSEQHQPVLLAEVLTVFADVSLSTFVDGTVGAGGHSSAIAHAHAELSQLVGLDVDPRALQLASARLTACNSKAKVVLENSNFSALQRVLQSALGGGVSVDGILLDIGVSSMQLDTSERGFSFSRDGPLDMRMGPSAKLSAADIVNAQPEAELGRIFREFGEERQWRRFARNICEARATQALHTTAQLLKAMRVPSTPSYSKGRKQIHPATRVFQVTQKELLRLDQQGRHCPGIICSKAVLRCRVKAVLYASLAWRALWTFG